MILNSWKEIAYHLQCSVRTAQRLEQEGMPVRRPAGHIRSAVVAFSDEIEAWLQSAKAPHTIVTADPAPRSPDERQLRINAQIASVRKQMAECRERSLDLRQRAIEIRAHRRSKIAFMDERSGGINSVPS